MALTAQEKGHEERLAMMNKANRVGMTQNQRELADAQHACREGVGRNGEKSKFACEKLRTSASQACAACLHRKE